jgi:hypothetical protein
VKEIEIDSFCPRQDSAAQAVGGQCSFSRFYHQKKKVERWKKTTKQVFFKVFVSPQI